MTAPLSQLRLVLTLHLHVPYGLGPDAYDRFFKFRLAPTVAALRDTPDARLTLHISGTLLRWLALNQGGCANVLKELVEDGRVELLAGGWSEPFLPALPLRDAVGQLELQTRVFQGRLGGRPKGGWVSHGAWDPSLVEIFARANLGYAVVPGAALLAAGKKVSDAHGVWLTERGGKPLRLLPGDVTLHQAAGYVPQTDLIKVLERRRAAGVELVTLALDASELGARLPLRSFGPWLTSLLAALTENNHWLRQVVPQDVLPRMAAQGRVYLPGWTPVELAESCHGRPVDELLGEERHYVRAGTWETLLSRYEPVNRVHKRLWLASAEVERLRRRLAREKGGLQDAARARSLEQATVALYRAQGSAGWFEGAQGGLYSPAVRRGVFASLAECESLVGRNLGEGARVRAMRLDYDRDGHEEILVRTPHFLAIVDPNEGGAITELSSFGVPGNVLDTTTRCDEPWHSELDSYTKLPRLVIEEEDDDPSNFELAALAMSDRAMPTPSDSFADEEAHLAALADSLIVDRSRRGALLDHFLGPATTPGNLARAAHPELGDFAGAAYRLVSAEESGPGLLSVVMTREGGVLDRGEARMVQIKKQLIFSRDLPTVQIEYDLTNRFQTTVESRFAVELSLALPDHGPGFLLADGVEQLSTEHPGTLENVAEIRLDQGGGRSVIVRLPPQAHADLFHYPVNAVVRRDGQLTLVQQSVCLVLAWPVQLWGEERKSYSLSLTIESRPPRR